MQNPLQWFCEDQPSDISKHRAFQVYQWLNNLKAISKLEYLRKIWTDGEYNYDFQLTPQGDRVRVWGGAVYEIGQIAFITDGGDFWVYWYKKAKWEFIGNFATTGDMWSSFVGAVDVEATAIYGAKRTAAGYEAAKWASTPLTTDINPLTVYPASWYESSLGITEGLTGYPELFLQNTNNKEGTVCARFPSEYPDAQIKFVQMNKLLYAYTTGETNYGYDRNGYGGVRAWLINMAGDGVGSGATYIWSWRPRFYCSDSYNPNAANIFYGDVWPLNDWYGPLRAGPSKPNAEIVVRFACLVDDKFAKPKEPTDPDFPDFPTASGIQGYCEVLCSIVDSTPDEGFESDDGEYNRAFFIEQLWSPTKNPYQFITDSGNIYHIELGGSPPQAAFTIDYDDYFGVGEANVPEIYWWTGNWTPRTPVDAPPDWIPPAGLISAVIANKDGEWTLHRRHGNELALVINSTNYIGHTVSPDGNVICVLLGVGEITDLYIYDIDQDVLIYSGPTNETYRSGAFIPWALRSPMTVLPSAPAIIAQIQDFTLNDLAVETIVTHCSSGYGISSPTNQTSLTLYKAWTRGRTGKAKAKVLVAADIPDAIYFTILLPETPTGPYSVEMYGQIFTGSSWSSFCESLPTMINYYPVDVALGRCFIATFIYDGGEDIAYPNGDAATTIILDNVVQTAYQIV